MIKRKGQMLGKSSQTKARRSEKDHRERYDDDKLIEDKYMAIEKRSKTKVR
jgi:hypothetical protein